MATRCRSSREYLLTHKQRAARILLLFRINVGRARRVNNQAAKGIKVHRSVKMRMEAEARALGKKYVPKLKFEVEPTWVD